MLFEQEKLTPSKRAIALSKQFHSYAHRDQAPQAANSDGHVPVEVLTSHGELERHLRYMLDAAFNTRPAAVRPKLRRIEHLLNTLPESIMLTLPATPDQDWMRCYRDLVRLHDMLDEAGLCDSEEEYATITSKMAQLAEAVSIGSAVSVNAGGMFTLWLMQAHLRRYAPRKRRPIRKKKHSHKHKRDSQKTSPAKAPKSADSNS